MEAGISYNQQKLHKAGYFRELLASNPDIDESLRSLLRQCREMVVRLGKTQSALMIKLPRLSARNLSLCKRRCNQYPASSATTMESTSVATTATKVT